MMENFIEKKRSLKEMFPQPLDPFHNLRKMYRYKNRRGGVGSGFINESNIVRATPVFVAPPTPIFQLYEAPNIIGTSNDTSPINIISRGPFDLQNISDDETYTTSLWTINDGQNILTGNNNMGFMIPIINGENTVTYDVTLTIYNNYNLSSSSSMQIIAHTEPVVILNGETESTFIGIGSLEQDEVRPFTFRNQSTGYYTSFLWTAEGITLSSNTDPIVTGQITIIAPSTPAVSVTLTLYNGTQIVGSITETTVFPNIITTAIASINDKTDDLISTEVNELDEITLNFRNTSVGDYTRATWSSTGNMILSSTEGPEVTTTFIIPEFAWYYPNDQNREITLTLFRGTTIVSTDTLRLRYEITANNASVIGLNMMALATYDPVPQSKVDFYQNVEFLTTPGIPAIEPTFFRIRTTNSTTSRLAHYLFQGRTDSNCELRMSTDTTKSNSGGTYRIESGDITRPPQVSLTVDDNMNLVTNIQNNRAGTPDVVLPPNPLAGYKTQPITIILNQPLNSVNNFDQFDITIPSEYEKTYITAYESYLSNSTTNNINVLVSSNYFGQATGRYKPVLPNATTVTFRLPLGSKYSALITGALRVNNGPVIWGLKAGVEPYASLFDITEYVNATGEITFGRDPSNSFAEVGSCFGFWSFDKFINDPPITAVASIDGIDIDISETVIQLNNSQRTFTFTNTSTGNYTNAVWTSTGILLDNTSNAIVSGVVTAVYPNQQQISVTLTLDGIISVTKSIIIEVKLNQYQISNAPEFLVTLPFPQTTISSGFNPGSNFYSCIECIPSTTKPIDFRFTFNHQTQPILGTLNVYSNTESNTLTLTQPNNTDTAINVNIDIKNQGTQPTNNVTININDLIPHQYNNAPFTITSSNPNSYDYANIRVPVAETATSQYITAADSYRAGGVSLSRLQNIDYFSEYQFNALNNNLTDLTFTLAIGDKYIMLAHGGVRVGGTIYYNSRPGQPYASLCDITDQVNTEGKVVCGKAAGSQGIIYAFFTINY